MRKNLFRKTKQHQQVLEGLGILIDEKNGLIYRLAVAPDGRCRVAQNNFDVVQNTVLGPAVQTWDYKTPVEAVVFFEAIKQRPEITWCRDDRVLYDKTKEA